MARMALHPGVLMPEALRLHRLHVGWQREARSEALLGDLERVLERGTSLERSDRTRQETQREPVRSESPPPPVNLQPTPQFGEPPSHLQTGRGADLVGTGSSAFVARAPDTHPSPTPHGMALIALVERIESFVRDGRPALSLELSGTGWTVDLERHALGGVVVRLQTLRGGQEPDLQALRAELRARGVTLRELSCGT